MRKYVSQLCFNNALNALTKQRQLVHLPKRSIFSGEEKSEKEAEKEEEKVEKTEKEEKKTTNQTLTMAQVLNELETEHNSDLIKQLKEGQKSVQSKLEESQKKEKRTAQQYKLSESTIQENLKKMKDLRDAMIGLTEDMDILRARTEKEKSDIKVYACQKFAKDMLDIQDNLFMALETSQAVKENNSLYEGVDMTYRILQKTLKMHGVEELDPLDTKFDPNKHEAMFEVEDLEKAPGMVAFVAQKGFTIGDRVLRAPKVGVVKHR